MTFNFLFSTYIFAILGTRTLLWFYPKHAPKVGDFQLHHYMYGLCLGALYLLISSPILLALGVALFVDELPLFFIFKGWNWPDNHWKQYHSWQSLVFIAIVSILGYFLLKGY